MRVEKQTLQGPWDGISSLAQKEKPEASSNVFKNWQQNSYFITVYNQNYSTDSFFQYAVHIFKKPMTLSNSVACQDYPNFSILSWLHMKKLKVKYTEHMHIPTI